MLSEQEKQQIREVVGWIADEYGITDSGRGIVAAICVMGLWNGRGLAVRTRRFVATYPERKAISATLRDHPLGRQLLAWRAAKAKSENKRAHHILHNRTLEELLKLRPRTVQDLQPLYGFGPVKLKAYGAELVKIIGEHGREAAVERTAKQSGDLTGQAALDRLNELEAAELDQNVLAMLKQKGPLTQATLFQGIEQLGAENTKAVVGALNRLRGRKLVLLKDGKYRLRKSKGKTDGE